MADPLLSASQDVEMRPPESSVATTASDPASSLRAAALLTLKSKRRKAPAKAVAPILPPRPPPGEPAFQLDYGQEEGTGTSQDAPPPPIAEPPAPSSVTETQAREEGEISDEEGAEPTTATQPIPRTPTPTPPRHQRHATPSTSAFPHTEPPHPKPKLSDRISDVPMTTGFAAFGQASDFMQPEPQPPPLEDLRYILDSHHVRPGVALNQEQYERAKDCVLDLLGWGVAPEYLVDCGLTREIVFYVFSELNLRLPQNLDTAGLVPFTADLRHLPERQKSSALMPPPPPPQVKRFSQPSIPSISPSQNSLPPSPSTANAPPTSPLAGPPRASVSIIPVSPKHVITGNLHDMEQQRRQELLARKAAIASRKSKPAPPLTGPSSLPSIIASSSPTPSTSQDIEMAVPTETVEDFLKTIGPPTSPAKSVDTSAYFAASQVDDDMDVDEIPGLGGARHYQTSVPIPPSAPSHLPPSVDILISPTQSSHTPMSPNEPPPSSTESMSTAFTETSSSSTSHTPLYTPSDTPALPEGPTSQRRGAKRPVAADFVDFDRPPSNGSGAYTNGFQAGSRRKIGVGFANVTSARRFIIDLSDSEGEGDGDGVPNDAEKNLKARPNASSAYASPIPTRPIITNLNTSGGWATPPVSSSTPNLSYAAITTSGTMSPAALVEKENEIQKMRELIAEREARRLNKIAAMRASASAESVTAVKREDTLIISTDAGSNFNTSITGESVQAREWRLLVSLRGARKITFNRRICHL
ncbi:hypothetical protein DXG03_004926 [Asterophora parasitica]|uniref:Uncharacterized protein n=1 Tax=Asterophora parasitica TaxID=117018 RepID=A0A9P7GD50_9AGAR|nr:hypothetical protein DXG03_004926 [Asterophora parasitica]